MPEKMGADCAPDLLTDTLRQRRESLAFAPVNFEPSRKVINLDVNARNAVVVAVHVMADTGDALAKLLATGNVFAPPEKLANSFDNGHVFQNKAVLV